MNMRDTEMPRFLCTIALAMLHAPGFALAAEKPHILFIAADDLRCELGCCGAISTNRCLASFFLFLDRSLSCNRRSECFR